jgi:hypothetical protein
MMETATCKHPTTTLTRIVSILTIQSVLFVGVELRRVTPEMVDSPETVELKVTGIGR